MYSLEHSKNAKLHVSFYHFANIHFLCHKNRFVLAWSMFYTMWFVNFEQNNNNNVFDHCQCSQKSFPLRETLIKHNKDTKITTISTKRRLWYTSVVHCVSSIQLLVFHYFQNLVFFVHHPNQSHARGWCGWCGFVE